ncbi:phenylalanine--tRNA ligase subunit beta [Acidocella sp.]|jgi:phenylalanyl-tRNA synthetase beta chain|uniref:phenylalanine--tRNA ligase subunit beta n=1 Tax=Acidocella sp. TaxID=50710 RepID=UPI002F3F8F96
MKFTLSWLKTWLQTEATLDEIVTTLSAIGLEVEGVENRAASLAPFIIAEIVEAVPHPNADRLRACRVNAGGAELSVVCGAPNARTGLKVVFAPPGAYVPGSGITLKVGEIRGVKSEGMLVSTRELGLGEDHDGIIELPEDAPVGTAYAGWAGLDDPVIEISVTPNRGDALSVRGVARDLAAAGLGTLVEFAPGNVSCIGASAITWRNEFPEACPWVLGRTVRGVTNGESPDWLKARLTSIGLRPINVLADITNFFTIDLGRPLHVFDADKVTGGALTLRRGSGTEEFAGLHGKPVSVAEEDCVIADANGVQSLAGIVGGEATGCDAGTTNVFIECALFDRVRIAQSGQRHGIFSDARQRFERGIDSQLLPAALDAATLMVLSLCGGTASEVSSAGARPDWTREASLRFARIKEFGGSEIGADEAVAALQRLGFGVLARDARQVRVSVPSWRNDIAQPPGLDQANVANAATAAAGAAQIEPEVDLLEEVLRLNGMDAIVPVSLPVDAVIPAPVLTPKQARTTLARRVLAARGLLECVTFSFLDHETAALFGDTPETLRLANPIAADLDQMRNTPVAPLALAAARNVARGFGDLGLFEIGPAYAADASQTLVAAGVRVGLTPLSALSPARPYDAMDAKADALAVLASLGVPLDAVTTNPGGAVFYHPGQSGTLRQGPKTVLASFGTLHPGICQKLDLPLGSVAFEVFLDAIAEPKRRRKATPVLPAFQPLRRDFAFLLPAESPVEALLRAAKGADRNVITNVALFDRYQGKGVPEGQVSLAIAVTLQPTEKSFSEAELEAISTKIVAEVAKKTGGVLRG